MVALVNKFFIWRSWVPFGSYFTFGRVLILAVVFSVGGCGTSDPESEEGSVPLQGEASINDGVSGPEVKMSGKDVDPRLPVSDQGVEYPYELENEFPLCQGCSPVRVRNLGGRLVVTLESCEAGVKQLYDYFLEKAESAGYSIGMMSQRKGSMMFMGENGSKTVSVDAGPNSGGNIMVSIMYFAGEE